MDWTQGDGHRAAAAAAASPAAGPTFGGPYARLMAATAASSGQTLAQLGGQDPVTGALLWPFQQHACPVFPPLFVLYPIICVGQLSGQITGLMMINTCHLLGQLPTRWQVLITIKPLTCAHKKCTIAGFLAVIIGKQDGSWLVQSQPATRGSEGNVALAVRAWSQISSDKQSVQVLWLTAAHCMLASLIQMCVQNTPFADGNFKLQRISYALPTPFNSMTQPKDG